MAKSVAETPPAPAPPRTQRVEDQRPWQLLRTHYQLNQGFALILISAPDEWTLSRIRAGLPTLLPKAQAVRDVRFEIAFQPEAFTMTVLGRGLPVGAPSQVWVEAPAPAVASTDPALHPWHAAFSHLNRHRNALPRELTGTLVIAGTPETIYSLRDSAPDLYSIRSALLTFDPAPVEPGHEDDLALKRQRLTAYRKALLAAFRPYQELAIDNFAAADQAAPDIWDIFVHPACAEEHLRPEEMDAAQRETPPRNPAVELLPLLAREDHRRTVLLGDPGMGKSTLIQALIAHLASGRALVGAPALTGLLPVPLILRDLVPLLPQDQVESWSWDALLDAFLCHYQRDEAALKLCDAFKDNIPEFREHLHTNPKVFFLIDGLDEIGDLIKRRKIVKCIQDGIRAVSQEARWLITSRVIGYDDATVDRVEASYPRALNQISRDREAGVREFQEAQKLWNGYFRRSREWVSKPSVGRPPVGNDPVYVSWWLQIAQRLYLAPFDDRRQDAFTQRWFQHRHSTDYSKELMREVRAHHHDGVRIISRVPNLLCLMNILKRSGKPLPDGRGALYDEIVKAYLGGIDAAYRLRPVLGNTCPFDAAQRRFLLALLGAHMQQQRVSGGGRQRAKGKRSQTGEHGESEGTILISKREIATLLVPVIKRLVAEGRVQSDHTAQELLDELLQHIASRSGLLIPRSSDEHGEMLFGFTHLSFMEFFAAEWLGMEFDRQRNRIVRQSLAREEGQELHEDDLDREFPPRGPVQHSRESFQELPALPAWHEPLIFLLETRKADAPTLLRWLFPALHTVNQESRTTNQEPAKPLLPLDAVRLLVKLTADPEIPISAEKRQDWWLRLWSAYLACPNPPWELDESKRWPIAPLLLGPTVDRAESLRLLGEAFNMESGLPSPPPVPRLYLVQCHHLTSADLPHLAALPQLEVLVLDGCTGLRSTLGLPSLPALKRLYLQYCTGLEGAEALQGLHGLPQLEFLDLSGCTGLCSTQGMSPLPALKTLVLRDCTSLEGAQALKGLHDLPQLKELSLSGCTGLRSIQGLPPLPALEKLWLMSCTRLEGAEALQDLHGLPQLKELVLNGCTGLTRGDAEALREAFRQQRGPKGALPRILGP